MYQVIFDIHSYWRAGTGRGAGALLDEIVHKDVYGLPCLPGRTVKGLLRDAVFRAEQWEQIPQGRTVCWFGTSAMESENQEIDFNAKPGGALGVSNAVLDPELRNYLIFLLKDKNQSRNTKGKNLCQGFFHHIHTTSIEHQTGSAKDQSLRAMEVTIPLKLTAKLHRILPEQLEDHDWATELAKCLPLIRAIGTSRRRGLGRVTVKLEKNDENSIL